MIKYSFNQYFRPYSNTQIRKFDYILINETPYIDDNLKVENSFKNEFSNKKFNYVISNPPYGGDKVIKKEEQKQVLEKLTSTYLGLKLCFHPAAITSSK